MISSYSFYFVHCIIKAMKKIPYLIIFLIISACQGPAVREPEYREIIEDPVEEVIDTVNVPRIEIFGIFFNDVHDADTAYISNGRISLIDNGGFSHKVDYNQYGKYRAIMLFDRQYTLRFSAPGYYTKFIEIDTRFIPDSIIGAGFLMPTDMRLSKAENVEVQELLENNPIGKACYREESNDLGWDFNHTDSIRALIDSLENQTQ